MRAKQLQLKMKNKGRGGARKGAGRKAVHNKGVRHIKRERVNRHRPLHINFKVEDDVKTLRNKIILRCLKRAILKARLKGLRITTFSMQRNHVHFIIEAGDNKILCSGMKALTTSFAKSVNHLLKRKGKLLKTRYFLHVLKAKREVKNAVDYVLHQRHGNSHDDEFTAMSLIDLAQSWLLQQVLPSQGKNPNI